MNPNNIKVFDFFCGCGGTSQGFSQSGMDIVFGVDFDKDAGESFKLNFPESAFFNNDIRELDKSFVSDLTSTLRKNNNLILFSGCAPCQPFSRQNSNKSANDSRINLLKEFGIFVQESLPDFVFIENVPGMQKVNKKSGPFADFINLLASLGYSYDFSILPALWFGVPQTRERLILIAAKNTIAKLPEPTHDGKSIPYATVSDWIEYLPPISAGQSHPVIPDHQSAYLSEINLERIKATLEGGGRESWPEHLILDCHKKHKGHTDVYGRLSWKKPASGLTTRCISYSNGRFGHPSQNRALSVREAACLQTFPIHFKFAGTLQSKAKQIGNAVPPLMAQAMGNAIVQLAKRDISY